MDKKTNNDFGWIKLHRSLAEWEWIDNPNVLVVFIHILLSTNYQSRKWRGVIIKSGQFVMSYQSMAKKTGLTIDKIRTAMSKLQLTNEIVIKSTNKYTLVTVNNWASYQANPKQIPNKSQANPKQIPNKSQQLKKVKKDKNIDIDEENYEKIELPIFIDRKNWIAFMKARKLLGAIQSEHAISLLLKKLAKFENQESGSAGERLEASIINGWKDVYGGRKNDSKTRNGNRASSKSEQGKDAIERGLGLQKGSIN